ncbi:MAG: HEPN domain-containing protein [bacterium]|nr:HEPN domain-containing protein [bacterium]
MPHEKEALTAEWLRIADEDMERSEIMLSHHNPVGAGFYLQQAVEKYLKALLILYGWTLRKTHDLPVLLTELGNYDRGYDSYLDICEEISQLYWAERYPPFARMAPTEADIHRLRQGIQRMIDAIKQRLRSQT